MKHINSILRTLCLTALLCITSVSASAYITYDGSGNIFAEQGIITVIEKGNCKVTNINANGCIIIKQGVNVTVSNGANIDPNGTLYVFGTLDITGAQNKSNMGKVYIMPGGNLTGTFMGFGTVTTITDNSCYSLKKADGKAPTKTEDGWKDYWQSGIACESDFYPLWDYADENCTTPITDFDAWKTGDGKLFGVTIGEETYVVYEDDTYNGDLTFPDKAEYQCNYDFTLNGDLDYSRDFAATGVWQAWFVPFDVTVDKMNEAGMEVAEIAGVLMDENKQPYIAFAKMKDGNAIVKANTPYVVKATRSEVAMKLYEPDFRKSTAAELESKRLTVQSSYNTFTFGGNYLKTTCNENQWYALNTSGAFQKMGKDAVLVPQRFWMTIDNRTDTPYYTEESSAAKAFIDMVVLGDDDPTGIESLTPTLSEGKGTIYNLQGQRVTSIQKGKVYIIDGKKYLAR